MLSLVGEVMDLFAQAIRCVDLAALEQAAFWGDLDTGVHVVDHLAQRQRAGGSGCCVGENGADGHAGLPTKRDDECVWRRKSSQVHARETTVEMA